MPQLRPVTRCTPQRGQVSSYRALSTRGSVASKSRSIRGVTHSPHDGRFRWDTKVSSKPQFTHRNNAQSNHHFAFHSQFFSIQQIPQQAPPEEPKKGANEHSTSHSPPSASSSTASSKEVAATHHGHVKKPLTYYFTWTGIKSLGPKIKEAAKHYWVGTKLFVFELRTATRIVRSVLNGHKLTRRERRQLKRTMMDLLRLVPFSVFVIVPFAEFLLPICLKIFPNMLPSTFEDKLKKEEYMKKKLTARIEIAKFLQESIEDFALDKKTAEKQGLNFSDFMERVKRGNLVKNEEILKFTKAFEDEFTLDNLPRPQLVALCKYMGIPTFGTNAFLQFQLENALAKIKEDDKLIQEEGVEKLSLEELRSALRARGMGGTGNSKALLRKRLQEWLELSLKHDLPASLLVLSRAFVINRTETPAEALISVISTLSDDLLEEVKLKLDVKEGTATLDQKLDVLLTQNELIEEEREALEQAIAKMQTDKTNGLSEAIHILAFGFQREKATLQALKEERQALKEEREKKLLEEKIKKEEEKSKKEREVVEKEKAEMKTVPTEGQVAPEAVEETKAVEKEEEAPAAEDKVTKRLESRLEKMLRVLEKDVETLEREAANKLKLDKDNDGMISADELIAAIHLLKDKLPPPKVQELIDRLDRDKDGYISVQELVQFATQLASNPPASSNSETNQASEGSEAAKVDGKSDTKPTNNENNAQTTSATQSNGSSQSNTSSGKSTSSTTVKSSANSNSATKKSNSSSTASSSSATSSSSSSAKYTTAASETEIEQQQATQMPPPSVHQQHQQQQQQSAGAEQR